MKSIANRMANANRKPVSPCLPVNLFIMAIACGALLLTSSSVALAQVYGVSRHTTVVSGPHTTVVATKTTVVAGGGLPHGYIAALPVGYRPVYVGGVRYYRVGAVHYRPVMYGGRTVYTVVRI